MTALVAPSASTAPVPVPGRGFAVSTVASDDLRAALRVEGTVTDRTCALLLGVVGTHLRVGRRYLRLDLAGADIAEAAVVDRLGEAHRQVTAAGGMLVLDNAPAQLAGTLAAAGLLVVPAG